MAWHKFFVAGLVGCGAIVGCTVTTSKDTTDAALTGTGGSSGSTASGGGGASAGGGGATASGGAHASGGGGATASGGATACSHADAGPDQPCTVCLKAKCASEYADCLNDAVCIENKATCGPGEFQNIQTCMFPFLADSGPGIFTAADLEKCSGDAAVGSVISAATDALVQCMHGSADASTAQPCTTECFGGEVPFQ